MESWGDGGEYFQIFRGEELLERWVAANRQMARDIPARWNIKKDEKQFFAGVAAYAAEFKTDAGLKSRARSRVAKAPVRLCISLFTAADALGLGFVRGVPAHLYLERLDFDVLRRLGITIDDSDNRADVNIRIPSNRGHFPCRGDARRSAGIRRSAAVARCLGPSRARAKASR